MTNHPTPAEIRAEIHADLQADYRIHSYLDEVVMPIPSRVSVIVDAAISRACDKAAGNE